MVRIIPHARMSDSRAVHIKKSVSCIAGGYNYDQSGGRNFFCSFSFFPLVRNDRKKYGKKKEN